jgi:hypothetical protein
MFAIPNTNTKKLKKTSIITNSLPAIDNGTMSPKPTDEKVIKLKYRNSKNCRENKLLGNVANLKFSEFKRYNA